MIPTVLCAPSAPRSPDQENLSQRIPHIAAALKEAKVTCVQIKYDGRFDCGDVQDPVYLASDGVPMDAGMLKGLQSELRVFFSELLKLRFPEWDNAEGARGEFQWDLALDRLAQSYRALQEFPAHRRDRPLNSNSPGCNSSELHPGERCI